MNPRKTGRQSGVIVAVLALCLTLAAASLQAGEGRIRRTKTNPVAGEYIVVLNEDVRDVPAVAAAVAKKYEGRVVSVWEHAVRGFQIAMPEGRALAMSHDPRVAWVEENAAVYLSATQATNVVPGCSSASCTHDRFWHLDRIEAATPAQDNTFRYCNTGDGVAIYIVDSGVERSHSEFGSKLENGVSVPRVRDGFNATLTGASDNHPSYPEPVGDYRNPAYQPCGASVAPYTDTGTGGDLIKYDQEIGEGGHGTSVASVAAGLTSGVAREAWIIPVKIFRCDGFETRKWQPQTQYNVGDRVGLTSVQHVAVQGGVSGSTVTFSSGSGALTNDNGVIWKNVDRPVSATAADALRGLDWILQPVDANHPDGNPDIDKPGVVNMSFYLNNWTSGDQSSFELAVNELLSAGLIVVTSANNQGIDACEKLPARMSPTNPISTQASDVVTVGGSMIRNNPEITSVNASIYRGDGSGGTASNSYGTEPIYDASSPTKDARWVCGAGDSTSCDGEPGSNYGQCVSVFAPAKNIASARLGGTNTYRDRLGKFADIPRPAASGTSFASPVVAGIAAAFLQHAPAGVTPADFHRALKLNGVWNQMEDSATAPLSGSPNLMARAVGVYAYTEGTSHTVVQNESVELAFGVSGPAPLSYAWYRGNPGDTSTLVATTSTGTVSFVPPSTGTYWVRVTSAGCSDALSSVDSTAFQVTVTEPTVTAPATVSASTASNSANVLVSWSAATGAAEYVVERSTTYGGTYSTVATVATLSFTDNPPVSAAPATYVYRVRGKDSSGNLSTPSVVDYATVKSSALFTDDQIPTNTVVLTTTEQTELRTAVNAVRAAAGLAGLTFGSSDAISASGLNALRTGLDEARAAMGLPSFVYSESIASDAYIRAVHFMEMHASVK